MENYQMRMAKATDNDIQQLRNFIDTLGEFVDNYIDAETIGDFVRENYRKATLGAERVIFGYEVLVSNACDPSLDYLDFKPEIKAALEAAKGEG